MKNYGKNVCMNIKSAALLSAAVFSATALAGPTEENHLQEAVKQAELAAKSTDAKAIAMHAEESRAHAGTADKHLDAGLDNLDKAIEHANRNEGALAKKAAEAAVEHLRAVQ